MPVPGSFERTRSTSVVQHRIWPSRAFWTPATATGPAAASMMTASSRRVAASFASASFIRRAPLVRHRPRRALPGRPLPRQRLPCLIDLTLVLAPVGFHPGRTVPAWLDQVMGTYNLVPMDARSFRCWAKLMHRRSDTLYEDAMIAAAFCCCPRYSACTASPWPGPGRCRRLILRGYSPGPARSRRRAAPAPGSAR